MTKTVQEEVNLSGTETIVMNANSDPPRTRNMVERLLSLQVPGAAFPTSQVDGPVVDGPIQDFVSKRGMSAVYLGYGAAGPNSSTVAIERRRGILEAVDHLAALRQKRVGFIGCPLAGVFAQRRKAAFLEGARSAGFETRVVDSDFTVQGGYFSCSKLLRGFEATAVMAASDLMVVGAMHYACYRQIPVPAALSAIGLDDITCAQFAQPASTTVAAPRAEIGRPAFQSLWKPINDSSQGGADCEVKTSLVIRQTTAPLPPWGRGPMSCAVPSRSGRSAFTASEEIQETKFRR